jgi:hypothetical protein
MREIKHKYKDAEEFIIVNNDDEDLYPITIKVPTPSEYYNLPHEEAIKKIDGYGLPPEKQKFKYQETPSKLLELEAVIRRKKQLKPKDSVKLEDIDEELFGNVSYYSKEIQWIKKQIRRHYKGYFFFNNGQPTYMPGCQYTYLNFWPIGNNRNKHGLPEYRDRDRRWFLTIMYAYTSKDAFYKYKVVYLDEGKNYVRYFNIKKSLDEFREKYPNSYVEEGNFLIDTGDRTIYGVIYPKHRREGATSRAGFMNWYITATMGIQRFGGIQSMSDYHSTQVFVDHIAKRLRRMPFFFKLMTEGSSVPKEAISFTAPASRAAGSVGTTSLPPHEGWINHRPSGERAYDMEKLHFIHHDEVGKIDPKAGININVVDRWRVVMKCLAQGPYIHGLGLLTSTLGEMEKGGGEQMKRLILGSRFNDRNDNGQTITGLITLFFPAYDGLDGFIDEFGNSIVEDPPKPIKNIDGKTVNMGAKSYLMNKRRAFEINGDQTGLIEEMQNFPCNLKECFMSASKDSSFPVLKIKKRITELTFEKHVSRRYNLEWESGRNSKVRLVEDDEGKFIMSYLPNPGARNLREWDTELEAWKPAWTVMNKFVLGADPAKYETQEVSGKKKSYNAAAMYYKKDESVDGDMGNNIKPRGSWVSDKFVLTYKQRDVSRDEYADDMAKACVFFGAMLYPEMNVTFLYERFIEWGFRGYLLYDMDENGYKKPLPGRITSDGNANSTKQDIFDSWENYLKIGAEYENHIEILEECSNIDGKQEMTKYDLFAAGGYALLGSKSVYPKFVELNEQSMMIDSKLFNTFDY